ncbi:MAG: DUF6163 family protein [Nitratireductor sp.]
MELFSVRGLMENNQENVALLAQRLNAVFLRIVAMVLLVYALQYWMRLTGFNPGPENRFDTMSEHWQIAASVLAVLLPVAALGLWGLFSWGIVVWFVAIALEIGIYAGLPDLYGRADLRVVFHVLSISVYLLFRFAISVLTNKK